MNEYQYYEFVALDRPLTSDEMAELHKVSARAEITSTRFCNEYHWGDLRADPVALVARYFDVHLCFANWGTRRVMFRLPVAAANLPSLRAYFPGEAATLTIAGEYAIIDIRARVDGSNDESYPGARLTASLTPLRSQLLRGDLRVAYLAWLLAVQAGEVAGDTIEPPVPHGVGLTASRSLEALIRFLWINPDLLAAAAEARVEDDGEAERFGQWVETLPPRLRDQWLLRAATYPDLALGAEMLSEFRRTHPMAAGARRTVRQLLYRAQVLAERRQAFHEERAR